MAALVCDLCGGKLVMGAGGIATCDSCGMEHSADRMKEKVQEIKGTVRVDNSHMVENYLELASTAYKTNNYVETESYANKTIEVEPTNYKAWLLKGKAAGWQSTLINPRVLESISAFTKSLNYAPENEKEMIFQDSLKELKCISNACINLKSNEFINHPHAEDREALINYIKEILNMITEFVIQQKNDGVADIKYSIALQIDQIVVQACENKIFPEYVGIQFPDEDEYINFAIGCLSCKDLLEYAISLCDENEAENIVRYENLISLEEELLNAYGWQSEYLDFGDNQWDINNLSNIVRNGGGVPEPENSRYWVKCAGMSDEGKEDARKRINMYKSKIKSIKAELDKKEAAEKAEKERIAREEAQKRFDSYWTDHAEEKASLEAEQKNLNSQIAALNASLNDQVAAFNKEIAAIPGKSEIDNIEERIKKLTEEKSALGLFKGKEKKVIQEQIDRANIEKKSIQERMDAAKKEIESKISSVKADIQKKISPLQNRVNTISNELTKAR